MELGKIRALSSYPPLSQNDFSWVPNLIAQLPRDIEGRRRERKGLKWVTFDDLTQVPGQIIRETDELIGLGENSRASRFRSAFLIQWLVTLPWRQRNIRECKLMSFADGGNLSKEEIPTHSTMAIPPWVQEALKANPREKFWQFCFRPRETKTSHLVRAIVPRQLVSPLEDYIKLYRPSLVNGPDPGTLFLNDHGGSYRQGSIGAPLGNVTFRYTGRRVNPHLFRDIFAVQWLEEHPEDYLTLSKILWHRNIQTTIRIYGAGFDESHGARRIEQWLDSRIRACGRTASLQPA